MMENHWLVLFLLFAIRLALAETDVIKEETTTKVSTEGETEIVKVKSTTEPIPVSPESELDEAPAPHLSLLNAPSSIKTASSGQRVKNPESGSAFGLPWQSVDVSSKGMESTSTTTTTTTLPPRVQEFNQHIRNQYKPQQQQQKPQTQQQQEAQIQQQYQSPTQQQQQIPQQSQYRPQSQSQYRPQFQQQSRPYAQQQSQQQVQTQQQTQQEVQTTQNRVQPAFQQQSQEKVQPSLQQQSQIQVQPSFAEQSQQKVQPPIQQSQQRVQSATQQRIQPTTQQTLQRVQPPSQQSQQRVQPPFPQQQQSQPAFHQVQSQEKAQQQIQQQTSYQYHQQSQPQVQDKFPPEFPKESYHHSIEEQSATANKQYKASGVKTAPAVQSVNQEEAGNEVDPKIKEPYQSQPNDDEKLKKADLALDEYFSDVLQNLSVKMKTGMDEPLGEVLDPVQLDDMQLQPLVAGQVFDVKMKKITVRGLSDFKVTQLESQLSESRIKVGIHYPKLEANCLFNANGSLYEIFKVTGKGNATIIFNDVYARTVLYLTKDNGVLQVTSADQPYVDFKSAEILFLDEEAPEGSEPIKAESVATQLGPLYFWVLTANAVDKIDYPLALYFNKALKGFPLSDFLDGYVLRQRHLRIHVPHNPLPYAYVSSDLDQK